MSAAEMPPKTIGFIVTQVGKSCTLYNAALTRRGGVLLPAQRGEPVVFFGTLRDAKRAISRTRRIAEQLRNSLVRDWPRLAPMTAHNFYEPVPVVRSHIAAKKESATTP